MVLSNSLLDIWKKVPNVYEILKLLADISDKWNEIGLAIETPQSVLQSLQRRNETDIVKLSEVLRQSSPVTWETMVSAIEGPFVNNKRKADEMRKHLGKHM